jgi:hypothetical protein
MTEQVQFPKTILAGVSEFGGILAVIKVVTMVMQWINRRQFEKKVTKFMQKEKAKAEELQESIAPLESRRASDIYRRKTFNIQDEENCVSDSLLYKSTTLPQKSLPTADEGDIKKRYSIEMFEELIQTVSILKQELSNLKTVVTQLS